MGSMVVVLYLQDWSPGTVSVANTPASSTSALRLRRTKSPPSDAVRSFSEGGLFILNKFYTAISSPGYGGHSPLLNLMFKQNS